MSRKTLPRYHACGLPCSTRCKLYCKLSSDLVQTWLHAYLFCDATTSHCASQLCMSCCKHTAGTVSLYQCWMCSCKLGKLIATAFSWSHRHRILVILSQLSSILQVGCINFSLMVALFKSEQACSAFAVNLQMIFT